MGRRWIAGAACITLLGLLALPNRAQEPVAAADEPQLTPGSRIQSILDGLAILQVRSAPETPASPFEPPGRPADRPIEPPPGQGNPPDPPGRPDDRADPPA